MAWARVLQARGNLNQAREDEKKSISMVEEIGTPRTDTFVSLADVLLDLGKAEEAANTPREAIELVEKFKLSERYR